MIRAAQRIRDMPRTTASSETPLQAVNLRVRIDTQSLIDRAANMLGRSRSDFMIDASKKAAENAILDQRVISVRSEEHTSELQSLMRISYAVFCLKKKKHKKNQYKYMENRRKKVEENEDER